MNFGNLALRRDGGPPVSVCPTCGKELGPEVRFCPDDGTRLTDTVVVNPALTPAFAGPEPPALTPGTVVGGRYQLEELRGGGGMAQVYRTTDVVLGRTVAVKLINPKLRTDPQFDVRFQREARLISQLADPHIVVVHDFGIDVQHGPYLVMEYLHGQTLREYLRERGPMPLEAALQLGGQLLLALSHAHEKGVLHRDVKPDNVYLIRQGGVRLHVRVLDFGIARMLHQDEPAGASLTRPGLVLGTPRYMAPEQLAGHALDARTDLYSAAVVVFEAVTGQLPYVCGKRLRELCPAAQPELESLLEQCLRQNPDERPVSAAEVYLRLHELGLASGALVVAPETLRQLTARFRAAVSSSDTWTYVPMSPARRNRLIGLGLLISLIAFALAALCFSLPRP
jgi:tRNA A-37 threonylcarbamoyl transferase component Bud32